MVVLITILSLNRLAWSTLTIYEPSKFCERKMAFHLASVATIAFLIHMLDQYIREFVTPSSSSYCSWNFRAGGVMQSVSYYAVWLFYWYRHRVIRQMHNIRLLSNVGLALLNFCFIFMTVSYLLFWGGKLKNGSCNLNKHFVIVSTKYNSGIVLWVTIVMDIVCSGFLCCVFLIPLFRSINRLEENTELCCIVESRTNDEKCNNLEGDEVRLSSVAVSAQEMKKPLRRAAWAAVLSALSTSLTLILLRAGSTWHSTLDELMCFVNIDGLLTAYSIHISFPPTSRWFWSWFKSRRIHS